MGWTAGFLRKEGMMEIFDDTLRLLERGITLGWARHGLLASNIANVETPGFRPRDLDFRGELERALMGGEVQLVRTDPRHLGPAEGQGVRTFERGGVPNPDGNAVVLEEEAVELAQNHLHYMALLRILQRRLELLKYTIGEGGR